MIRNLRRGRDNGGNRGDRPYPSDELVEPSSYPWDGDVTGLAPERAGGGRWAWAWTGAWWWDLPGIGLLLALSALFLREVPGALPPYGGDVLVHVYPLLSLLAHGARAGRPTLWNFYAAGGYPLAPYGALAFYPPVVLSLLTLTVTGALATLDALYVGVLAVGAYLLAADLGLSRPARLLAGATLAYGGFVAANVYAGHILELGAVCPTPLAFLLLRRAIRRHSLGAAVGCGVTVGLMVLAAGLQFLPFALAPLPLLALWHAVAARRIWPILTLLVAGLIGAGLGAVLLLPFYEVVGYSLRAGAVPFATAAQQSLPWNGLTMLVAPNALGTAPADTYWPASRFGPYFHEIYAYAGLLPLLLAPLALIRRRAAWPYGLLALLALLVMLGDNTPLYRFLYGLPGAGSLRAPARAGLILDFSLAILAAFGLDVLRDTMSFRRALQLLVPGALIVAVALGWLLLPFAPLGGHALRAIPAVAQSLALDGAVRLIVALVIGVLGCIVVTGADARVGLLLPALALLDLFNANGTLLRPADPAGYFRTTAAHLARMDTARGVRDVSSYRLWAPDGSIPLGLGMVTRTDYDVQDAAPLALADYWTISHRTLVHRNGGAVATGRDVISDVDPFFLRLFGVHTVLASAALAPRLPSPPLRPVGSALTVRWHVPGGARWNTYATVDTSFFYRDDAVLPRAFVVPAAVSAPDASAALALLQQGTDDPARVAVLSPSSSSPGLPAWIQDAWASWLAGDDDNALTLRADGGRSGGYLVVDDGWFPGWTATVDGHDAPVLRADDVLRAVRLPPGRHAVRMVYAPLTYLAGAAITLATTLLLLLAALIVVVRRPRRPRHPRPHASLSLREDTEYSGI